MRPCIVCLSIQEHLPSPRDTGIKLLGKHQSQLSSLKLLIQHCLCTELSDGYERWSPEEKPSSSGLYFGNWDEQPENGPPCGSRTENPGRMQKQEDWVLPWAKERGWVGKTLKLLVRRQSSVLWWSFLWSLDICNCQRLEDSENSYAQFPLASVQLFGEMVHRLAQLQVKKKKTKNFQLLSTPLILSSNYFLTNASWTYI